MNILGVQINKNITRHSIFISQIICLYAILFINQINHLSLDTTSYAHITNQIAKNNFYAIFNLTWSTLTPIFAAIFCKLGFSVITSLTWIQFIFCSASFYILNKSAFQKIQKPKILIAYIPLYTVLILEISTGTSDPAFLFFLLYGIFLTNKLYTQQTLKLEFMVFLCGVLASFSRPVGIYIFLLVFVLNYLLIIKRDKSYLLQNVFFRVILMFLCFVIFWGFFLGKFNKTSFTIGKTGQYGMHVISPLNGNSIIYNSRDKWTPMAKVYHSDIEYKPNRKFIENNRKINQWRWTDIAAYIDFDIERWPEKWDKENIEFMIKYYISNVYVFFKDYALWMFIFIILILSNLSNFNQLKWIMTIVVYINLFFITHIEFRYLIPGFILLIAVITNQENLKIRIFNTFQILVLLNLSMVQLYAVKSYDIFHALSSGPFPKFSYFTTQKFNPNKQINYISRENINAAYLIVNNPNLYFKGNIKPETQLNSIKDTSLNFLYFKSDTAFLIPINQAKKQQL